MKIGTLAKRADVAIDTVRYYELLALSARRDGDMAGMKSAAQQKLADVDAKLAELQRIRQGLTDLVASCPGHGALEHCPILDALAGASR